MTPEERDRLRGFQRAAERALREVRRAEQAGDFRALSAALSAFDSAVEAVTQERWRGAST